MARGSDPGKDFDSQFNRNKARGDAKAQRGESHWSQDKYIQGGCGTNESPGGGQDNSGCGDKTVILLAILGGFAWAGSEIVNRII